MAKDHRLKLNRYIDSPFENKVKLNFHQLFATKPETGDAPWIPSRLSSADLLNKLQTRKLKLNPNLNFVGDDSTEYQMFAGLGHFDRIEDYDFNSGRPRTAQNPRDQPDFTDLWVEAYRYSPTINPEKKAKNPMPRAANPDPRGFIMAQAERRAESEMEGNKSVAELLAERSENKTEIKPNEAKQPASQEQVKEQQKQQQAGPKT
jgi:hypothetical protein